MRLRASSFIESAVSLLIFGILLSCAMNIIKFIEYKRTNIEVQKQIHEISIAAAKYAADHGYLPMPIDEHGEGMIITGTTPEEWFAMNRYGFVPWKELKMAKEPVVNGKRFTWHVAATAIERHGWKYSPSTDAFHMSPQFWANIRHATFARPRWCGISDYPWWDIDDGSSSLSLTDRAFARNMHWLKVDNSQHFEHLYPAFQHSPNFGILLFPILTNICNLEFDLSLCPAEEWPNIGRYVRALISTPHQYHMDIFYGKIMRLIWVNEYVLIVSHPDFIHHSCDWTRFGLLEAINIFPCREYVHPGYKWVEAKTVMSDHSAECTIGNGMKENNRWIVVTRMGAKDHLLCLYLAEWFKAALKMEGLEPANVSNSFVNDIKILQTADDYKKIAEKVKDALEELHNHNCAYEQKIYTIN